MSDGLKFAAYWSMVFDHWRRLHAPGNPVLILLGRLAFPVFAWGIAQGVHHTRNCGRYVVRLTALAVISQPFYTLAGHSWFDLNICFTLAAGASLLGVESGKLPLPWLFLVSACLYADAGASGVLLVWAFGRRSWPVATLLLLWMSAGNAVYMAGYSVALVLLLNLPQGRRWLPSWWFYAGYPIHFLWI